MIIQDHAALECHPYCLAIPEMTEEEFAELKEDISGSGQLEPIIIFEGMILDGRHRFRACNELGIEPWFQDFDGPDSAKDYVVSKNLKRRNLTQQQKVRAWGKLCGLQRGSNQYKPKSELPEMDADKSTTTQERIIPQAEAAKELGVSRDLMMFDRKVSTKAAPEINEAVDAGELTLTAAAKLVDELPDHEDQRKVWEESKATPRKAVSKAKEYKEKKTVAEPAKPKTYITLSQWKDQGVQEVPEVESSKTFNRQGDSDEDSMGNIEWAKWSWNPVTGCKHDCSYCYARDIAARFYEQGFEPSLLPERLRMPYNTKVPGKAIQDSSWRNVFANSMSDLYGRWVPQEWIDAVFKAMAENPQWNFLTLTKFPKRAAELTYPENVWIGTSVDLQARVKAAEEAFERIECGVRWLSIEPMIEPLQFSKPELFDWVVIGGASKSTKTPDWTPPFSWIARLAAQFLDANPDVKIYLKTNGRPREMPGVITQQNADESFFYLGKK